MAPVLLAFLPVTTGILVLMAAITLSLGGAALVAYSIRTSGQEWARRVRLVQRVDRAGARAAEKAAANAVQMRAHSDSAEERDRSEILRRFGRFGVSQDRALTLYLGIRLG